MNHSIQNRRCRRAALLAIAAAAITACVAPAGASAALSANVAGGELRVAGDGAGDQLSVVSKGAAIAVDFGADGTIDGNFPRDGFSRVAADLGGGDDMFVATGNLADQAFAINGGPGADQLLGTNAIDTIVGGSGDDQIDAQQANDDVRGGTGDDTIAWDPGDGSDTVDGGGDSDLDTLDFGGSNIEENFTISGEGSRVRLTRNISNIVMLLDRVDVVDLESFGGADRITAAGTNTLTHLRIDAGAGLDIVTTGDGADRILGGPGVDTLSGHEGDDGIDGGDDGDTINGGANIDGCDGGPGADAITECESVTMPADLVPQPFAHPLEPEETQADPDPQDPDPADPDPADPENPGAEAPASPGFAIDRVRADRRGLRVELASTAAEPVEVEVEATETMRVRERSGKRKVAYASVTRSVPAGERVTVRLKAPRRHRSALKAASRRKVSTTVTNVTNGLSQTEAILSGR